MSSSSSTLAEQTAAALKQFDEHMAVLEKKGLFEAKDLPTSSTPLTDAEYTALAQKAIDDRTDYINRATTKVMEFIRKRQEEEAKKGRRVCDFYVEYDRERYPGVDAGEFEDVMERVIAKITTIGWKIEPSQFENGKWWVTNRK